MDRWVVERINEGSTFGLYNLNEGLDKPVARFEDPNLAYLCAGLLNKQGLPAPEQATCHE